MVRAQKRARQYDDERGIRMSADIGIDLGTASVLVYVKGKGVILKEPSVVAYDRDSNAIKAIGEEARLMLGRTREISSRCVLCARASFRIIPLRKR